jgi:AcrR family transcriptional regulator
MAGSTRDRILSEATRLFAERGIKGTTVAEIEAAAGLRPGSGGVHRYFPTKDDLVRGVLAAQLVRAASVFAEARAWDPPTRETVPEFLTQLGHYMLTNADDNREVALIMLREAHNLPPGVLDEHQAANLDVAYATTAAAIRARQATNGTAGPDADALAFLVVAPLVYFRLIEWATGDKPLDLDDDRLVTTWVELFTPVFERLIGDA